MKRIAGMILVVAMVASLGIVSVFAADTREDEMPATCIAEITESGEVIYYVEDEPKENDEATAPATWVADVGERRRGLSDYYQGQRSDLRRKSL